MWCVDVPARCRYVTNSKHNETCPGWNQPVAWIWAKYEAAPGGFAWFPAGDATGVAYVNYCPVGMVIVPLDDACSALLYP